MGCSFLLATPYKMTMDAFSITPDALRKKLVGDGRLDVGSLKWCFASCLR